ncbi:Transmembrane ascorbate ferrireductase 2 [Linum perenne]
MHSVMEFALFHPTPNNPLLLSAPSRRRSKNRLLSRRSVCTTGEILLHRSTYITEEDRLSSPTTRISSSVHPVLMVIGLLLINGEGTKNLKKLVHLGLQFLALCLSLIGVWAALKFHNDKGIDNFYSLHSRRLLGSRPFDTQVVREVAEQLYCRGMSSLEFIYMRLLLLQLQLVCWRKPHSFKSTRYLAMVLYHARDMAGAIIQQHKELIINERCLGLDHPDTAHRHCFFLAISLICCDAHLHVILWKFLL